MSRPSFAWCASCGYILAGVTSPPEGTCVTAALLYTNATNPAFPLTVTRMGTSLRRHSDLLYVSPEGAVVPASAVVACQPEAPDGRHKARAALRSVGPRHEPAC